MKRAVRTLIRLLAAGLVLFGGIEMGLDYMHHHLGDAALSVWAWIIGIVLIALGAFLFAASESLAEQLTDDIDE